MLPKLAEIFGVTTDALLGRESAEQKVTVHTAEVVDDDEEKAGVHVRNGGWEFHWERNRLGAVVGALFVLTVGVLTLLARVLQWDVTFWQILWPCALLGFGFSEVLKKFSFFYVGFILFGGYFLLNNLGVLQLELEKGYVFPVLIILFGLSLLADLPNKPKKSHATFTHSGERSKAKRQFELHEQSFEYTASFGDGRQGVALDTLEEGEIHCSFGDYTVDLGEVKAVTEDAELEINCAFGQVTVLIPRRFRVVTDSSAAFGDVTLEGTPEDKPEGMIRLEGNVSFGQIVIRYI
jgi:predicted membrane protein